MLHNILHNTLLLMLVQHLIGAMRIRDDEIDYLLVSATPTVDDSGVVVKLILYGFLHSCQGELLLFVVAVTTDLDSHGTDEASIDDLKVVVLSVERLAIAD